LSVGLGERSGLSEACPAGCCEVRFKPRVATLQTIAAALGARQGLTQARNLFRLAPDHRIAVVGRRWRAHSGHALVMPGCRNLYKYKILDLRRSALENPVNKDVQTSIT